MEKIKSWLKSKTAKVATAASVVSTALMVGAGAEDQSTTAIMSSFTTGFGNLATDALTMIAAIVPIALGVAGVQWLTRKALGWFKSMSK